MCVWLGVCVGGGAGMRNTLIVELDGFSPQITVKLQIDNKKLRAVNKFKTQCKSQNISLAAFTVHISCNGLTVKAEDQVWSLMF